MFPSAILSDCGQHIRREIITHAQLRHPNVIEFLGVFREDENEAAPLIILPFLEKGSALCYLNQLSAKELLTSTSSIVSHFSVTSNNTMLKSCCVAFPAVRCRQCTRIFARQRASHLSWRRSSSAQSHLELNNSPSDLNSSYHRTTSSSVQREMLFFVILVSVAFATKSRARVH